MSSEGLPTEDVKVTPDGQYDLYEPTPEEIEACCRKLRVHKDRQREECLRRMKWTASQVLGVLIPICDTKHLEGGLNLEHPKFDTTNMSVDQDCWWEQITQRI